jgi:hypothetical protein
MKSGEGGCSNSGIHANQNPANIGMQPNGIRMSFWSSTEDLNN